LPPISGIFPFPKAGEPSQQPTNKRTFPTSFQILAQIRWRGTPPPYFNPIRLQPTPYDPMLRASAEGRNPKMAKTRHAPGQITRVHSRNRLYVLSSPLYHHSRLFSKHFAGCFALQPTTLEECEESCSHALSEGWHSLLSRVSLEARTPISSGLLTYVRATDLIHEENIKFGSLEKIKCSSGLDDLSAN
jgi:hypothetical protein